MPLDYDDVPRLTPLIRVIARCDLEYLAMRDHTNDTNCSYSVRVPRDRDWLTLRDGALVQLEPRGSAVVFPAGSIMVNKDILEVCLSRTEGTVPIP